MDGVSLRKINNDLAKIRQCIRTLKANDEIHWKGEKVLEILRQEEDLIGDIQSVISLEMYKQSIK